MLIYNMCLPFCNVFWATVCKTSRRMLSDRCLSCLSCLWRWCIVIKQLDGSRWHLYGGRPGLRPHCARWGPSSPSPEKGSQPPNFRPRSIVAKRLHWIKVPLGVMQVSLGPGHTVLHADPAPPTWAQPQFSAHVYCGQTVAHLSYCWALVYIKETFSSRPCPSFSDRAFSVAPAAL